MKKDNPPLIRVYGSLIYELFALVPIWMVAGFIFIYFFDDFFGTYRRLIFQIYLWLISGFYLTYCWTKSGQTVAMRAWKLKIISRHGALSNKLAWKRYIYATLGALMGGIAFIWALTNKKHLYLHDQILNNHFIDVRFYKSSSHRLKKR
ncbi:RDD family protein [Candidatus Methylopumilus planktonicus]|uniref:RDD family protein n=1 Tax=Candidatus Methylopumilus TaxID=1679002 RepID=UPI001122FFD7|nr:RDD family protein [Candidatus Methylopumilus planktonicus]QDD01128.1 RDD family protein [Candidatus Methylopumilus planktonicus]